MMNSLTRNILLTIILVGIIGTIVYLESQKAKPSEAVLSPSVAQCITGLESACTTTNPLATSTIQSETAALPKPLTVTTASPDVLAMKARQYKKYVEIVNPSGFINTGDKPLAIASLIGKKVVLVDFWTYSCINCQRTLPYLTNWYTKYKDAGLEIVSIHTPEFEFEKVRDNVVKAAQQFGIIYPIVQDNDYGTWRAYNNFYWPRKYLIDIDGFIVYDHIGEGAYEETAHKIEELLDERAKRLGMEEIDIADGSPIQGETVDSTKPRTQEIYFGALRNEALSNGQKNKTGTQDFVLPPTLQTNELYLVGSWAITGEYAKNTHASAQIILKYQAQKVFMVARADSPITAKILIDGQPIPKTMRGADVSEDGTITIKEDRLYRLVEDSSWDTHTIEIIPEAPGLEAFTFTFG